MPLPFQEIIEFPILKLNGRTMEIESTFHMYVQPVVHPQLTPFCTEVRARGLGGKCCRDGGLGIVAALRESSGLLRAWGRCVLDPAGGILQSLPPPWITLVPGEATEQWCSPSQLSPTWPSWSLLPFLVTGMWSVGAGWVPLGLSFQVHFP